MFSQEAIKLLGAIPIIVLLFSISTFAQISFEHTYGGSAHDWGECVRQTSDGGYIIVGRTDSYGAGGGDVYFIKTDPYGDILWTRTYGGSSTDGGYWVQQTSDGGYVFVGYTYSFDAGCCDIYLIKIDNDGNVTWRWIGRGGECDYGHCVRQTSDKGYVIVGERSMFPADFDIYLIKINPGGDINWARQYKGSRRDFGRCVQQTSDGGYIIVGWTQPSFEYDCDIYLIKTDENGNILWTRTYGGPDYDWGHSVQQTSDGGYVIGGTFGADPCGGRGYVYLIKTDSEGDTLWTHTYGGPIANMGYSVQQTFDGGYIVVGTSWSSDDSQYDVYLVKTDPLGDTLWTRTYGGPDWDVGRCVRQTSDGGYIVVGDTYSFGAGQCDVYLIKTDSRGLTGVKERHQVGLLNGFLLSQNFPNPFNSQTIISYSIPKTTCVDLCIYDVRGKIVRRLVNREIPAGTYSVRWDGKDACGKEVSSGIYFYRLKAGDFVKTKRAVFLK